jgi:hypothetical protein
LVDLEHDADLGIALQDVVLVDADGIDPVIPVAISEVLEEIAEVVSDSEWVPITQDLVLGLG